MFSFFKKNKGINLYAPLSGTAVNISEVPDAVFAEKMVGDGLAINPTSNKVVAPCDGKVVQIFPTNHAIGMEIEGGVDLLIHVGIDTVELNGEGFKRLVEEGTQVKKGDPILEIDFDKIREHGKPTITPVIVTNVDAVTITSTKTGEVKAGETVIMNVKPN
ncbi:MAG: PTS sugar transporter subunit IIA [Cellulosilyticaceae bacterium]